MFGSHGTHFVGSTVAGLLLASPSFAQDVRDHACAIDEDCAAGSYCRDDARCVSPLALGEACARHAMCDSGLCVGDVCGGVTIESPIDGVATGEPKLVVRGTAPAGAFLEVACGDHADIVVADEAGGWLWVPGVALADGRHAIVARAGLAEVVATIDVDTTRPALQVFSPSVAQVTAREDVEIRGRIEPGAHFALMVDGQETFVSVDAHGDWSHRQTFAHGQHRVIALATDAVGNLTRQDFTFSVDLEAPGVAITWPAQGSVFAEAPRLMSGLAEPGAILRVDGHGAGVWLTVPERGGWSWAFPRLGDGTHSYTVTVFDRAGWSSSESLTLTIDGTAPGLAVNAPVDGARVAVVRPALHGMADEGSAVVARVDGVIVGGMIVGGDGRWSVTPDRDLAEGERVVAVTATDRAGNETVMQTTLTIDLTAPTLSVVAAPRVAGEPVRISGATEARASVEVRVGGLLAATAIADRQGAWQVEIDVPDRGEHVVGVLARDVVGLTTEGAIVVGEAADELVTAGGGCAGAGPGGPAAIVGAALLLIALRRRAA